MLLINSNWLKPIEAARRLQVSLRTMRRYLAEGRFPNAKQTRSGRWWIPVADLEGWIVVPRATVTPSAKG